MMTRFTLALLGASFLFTTACAAEQKDEQRDEQKTQVAAEFAAVGAKKLAPSFKAPDADWRDLDLENTLYIKTIHGIFVIELASEFAPNHVNQIKTLVREKFYDDITFHRVIDGFMNQTGDPKGDGTGDSHLPDIQAEFTFRRSPSLAVTLFSRESSKDGEVDTGFYKSFPLASKPISQAMLTKDGKVEAWALHCRGTTSMARGGDDVNSGNSQFFLMRGEYTSLNQLYSIWGRTVWGNENLSKIKIGTVNETKNFVPDVMLSVRVAADVPEVDRIPVQVLKTSSNAFKMHVESLKSSKGKLPKVCDIPVPSRLKP